MSINLRDYSRTAAQRGWGAGWPSCAGAKGNTVVVTLARSGTRISVHRGISRLVSAVMDDIERRGYLFRPKSTGAYNCRPIGGTKRPSNHSWALAIDGNWDTNPMRRPLTTDYPAWVVQTFNRYGFAWGGHYSGSSTPDSMHFEFLGTPADADAMTALALRELVGVTAPATVPAQSGVTLQLGSSGPAVTALQQRLKTGFRAYAGGLVVDGDFGPATKNAVMEFQRRSGLTADGIVGPATRRALGI